MSYGLRIKGFSAGGHRDRVPQGRGDPRAGAVPADASRAQLSGGQRQRVAMGRAIVREPAVFLFDEPLSNLDAKLRVQMRAELQALHRRLGTTSLYVTHDQVEAMTLAHRMIVMNAGRAEQIGAPLEVYAQPGDDLRGELHRLAADEPDPAGAQRQQVLFGIRPEHLEPCAEADAMLVARGRPDRAARRRHAGLRASSEAARIVARLPASRQVGRAASCRCASTRRTRTTSTRRAARASTMKYDAVIVGAGPQRPDLRVLPREGGPQGQGARAPRRGRRRRGHRGVPSRLPQFGRRLHGEPAAGRR